MDKDERVCSQYNPECEFSTCWSEPGAEEKPFITAYWFEWAPAQMLEELSKDFTAETGIGFKMSTTAVENWVQKINVEMVAKSDAYDLIIADSQDVGTMVKGGHFIELTDWIKQHKVDQDFTAASMTAYSEYPKGSGKYWACRRKEMPSVGPTGKDLFEDPKNKEAFQKNMAIRWISPETSRRY